MSNPATAETTTNPYTVLGVSPDATASQIKTAYRKLALQHHPDRQPNEESKARATQLFSQISNAYEIVGDDAQRREYDMQQQRASAYHSPQPFHDPFDVFAQVFGDEFGSTQRSFHRSPFADPFFQQDPFFGGSNFFGNVFGQQQQPQQQHQHQHQQQQGMYDGESGFGGGDPFGGDPFSLMNRQMERMVRQQQLLAMQQQIQLQQQMGQQIGQQQQQQQQQPPVQSLPNNQGGGYFYSSSSSSNFGDGGGGRSESVSTTTRMVNGKRQTVTERVITNPDGTVERQIETRGGDDS